MDTKTVDILRTVTNDFYRNHADSFSQTRTSPWRGWKRVIEILRENVDGNAHISDALTGKSCPERELLTVFDLACGNLRFEQFLQEELPGIPIIAYGIDNCDALLPTTGFDSLIFNYQHLDVLRTLQQDRVLTDIIEAPPCDICVCFGFMHHVPTQAARIQVLDGLIRQTRPGGFIALSFWQFMNSEKLRAKACASHEKALSVLDIDGLGENDYLYGWQHTTDAFRYCHSFTDAEINRLIEAVSDTTTLVSRFSSDGRTHNLNTYVVLRVALE